MTTAQTIYEAATFADLPGWDGDDHLAAFRAFLTTCGPVTRTAQANAALASAPGATADAMKADAKSAQLAEACRAAQALERPTRAAAKTFFETHFQPHRVLHKGNAGMLTGYYEPVLEGSRTPVGEFKTPIYRRPPDLINVVAETERASKSDGLSHVRKTAAGTAPFPTRAEIESGALAGQGLELVYLNCPVDAFFMHIQGSARIKLQDGSIVRLNYDGKNGHPYSSIGRYLIDHGLLAADKVSLQALRKWLRADPERGRHVMWQNASFIFFRELDGIEASEGPLGALNTALTPGRSLAVDTAYHRLGSPVYVSAPTLKHASKSGFNRLMIAQDVGSAIKGPERGDIYFGSGEKAGRLAGTTKHPGSFFVLLPVAAHSAAQVHERLPERLPWQKIEKAER
jgi:membrane-bound lytic murein transglycosylase A